MGQRRFKTDADIARFVKQGYGQGEGSSYKPWVRVQDVPSIGRSRKTPGLKSKRMHQFFSDLEFRYFLLLEFSDLVVDIREQYPLFATTRARDIAAEMGIQYPVFVGTQLPFVLTSDFVVTLQEEPGAKKRLAIRTCKYEHDLVDPNGALWTIDKLDLERAIWADKSVTDWKVVTEQVGTQILFDNLEWLRKSVLTEPVEVSADLQSQFMEYVVKTANGDRTMSSVVRAASTAIGVSYRSGMRFFKHLLWHKCIVTDIANTILDPTLRCPMLSVPATREAIRRAA